MPVEKALEDESLIAWAMNGEDIPAMNGYPLRLVIAGWPGSVAGKWLKKIVVRNQVHDGAKMTGTSYRVPCKSVAPGTTVPDDEMCIIESMPVKSLITFPKSGIEKAVGQTLALRGHAWAGDRDVTGKLSGTLSAIPQTLGELANADMRFAPATDSAGHSQPMVLPGWNPKGYLNNACHRIAIQVV